MPPEKVQVPLMRLDRYTSAAFDRGAARWKEALWMLGGVLLSSWLPGSAWRRRLLVAFGARIGSGVVIKPHVRVKFPWRLTVGDHSWIGEDVWIDNLATVTIGSQVCLSQGAYLCTGSHDWKSENFDLITEPILIESHAWLGAMSRLAPGAVVRQGAVLSLAGVGRGELKAWMVYAGSPATPVRARRP